MEVPHFAPQAQNGELPFFYDNIFSANSNRCGSCSIKYRSNLSAFSGDRWLGVVFHLYKVFAFMPVAAAMDLMLEPGRLIAVSNKVSSSAKVVYFRIGITSHKEGARVVVAFTFFLL